MWIHLLHISQDFTIFNLTVIHIFYIILFSHHLIFTFYIFSSSRTFTRMLKFNSCLHLPMFTFLHIDIITFSDQITFHISWIRFTSSHFHVIYACLCSHFHICSYGNIITCSHIYFSITVAHMFSSSRIHIFTW